MREIDVARLPLVSTVGGGNCIARLTQIFNVLLNGI